MSNEEARRQSAAGELDAHLRLDEAVDAVVSRITALEEELEDSRRKSSEMRDLLRRFTEGEEAPSEMAERLRRLEEENRDLLERVNEARQGVKRMLARIRFLEEKG